MIDPVSVCLHGMYPCGLVLVSDVWRPPLCRFAPCALFTYRPSCAAVSSAYLTAAAAAAAAVAA